MKRRRPLSLEAGRKIIAFICGLIFPFGSIGSGRAGELATLKANYSGVSGAFAPLWIAQDKGLFVKYGLAIDLKFVQPGTATQALLAGSLDIVNPGGELIEAGLSGERVVFLPAFSIALFSLCMAGLRSAPFPISGGRF